MCSFLMVERMVIESLEKKPRSLEQLMDDTGLDYELAKAVLFELTSEGYIYFKKGVYVLNREKIVNNSTDNSLARQEEIDEIFSSFARQDKKEQETFLKVDKIYLDDDETKLLWAMLKGIESYISNIRQDRKRHPINEKTSKKKVIFLGVSPYENLVKETLRAV